MKTENLIKAAEDLNTILGLNPPIDIEEDTDVILTQVKEGALWLVLSDKLEKDLIRTLKQIKWEDSDFENMKADQDPRPLFIKCNIIKADAAEVVPKPGVEKKPLKKVVKKKSKEFKLKELPQPGQKKLASAYSTALAVMATDPSMSMAYLYEIMKAKGFNIQKVGNSCKTARSSFRKVHALLDREGRIKEKE